jgi:molecular chaperone DnaK
VERTPILGIDFGTTNSCVAVMQGDRPRVIPSAEGEQTTPSVVAFLEDGERLVGAAAKRQAIVRPERTIASVKRFLGRQLREVAEEQKIVPYRLVAGANDAVRIEIEGRQMPPEVAATLIFAKLKADAEAFLGEPVGKAVVTVPAYFNEAQRSSVRSAAAAAGIEVVRLLNEPTAAALAYGYAGEKESGSILVFDLGGGTFDVSALEIGEGVFEVLATAGDNHLGGDDFDKAIVDWLLERFQAGSGVDLSREPFALQRLYEAAERAKKELSSAAKTTISLPFLHATESGPLHLEAELTRSELRTLARELLERLEGPILRCLELASLRAEDIDDVILVGGMTRMPAVIETVERVTGRVPHRGISPDEAVALGAAIQGAIVAGELSQIVLLDVTPLSLGIATRDGLTAKLIAANSSVPTRVSQIFTTGQDNQRSVEVRVVQGERELASENRLLGRLQLLDIAPAPRGRPDIEVTFDLSVDGLLTVSARDLATGSEQKMALEPTTGLSEDEVERMRSDAERFAQADRRARALAQLHNVYDELREQALLCLEQLPPGRRFALDERMREAEQALSGEDVQSIADALERLSASLREAAASGALTGRARRERTPRGG